MTSIDDIIQFLKDVSGSEKVDADTDIFNDLGMVGDDFHEMIEKFAMRYSVNMTDYLWYFHADEEGQNFGGLFFKPPYRQVERIAVTPKMLFDFACKGKWDLQYPAHKISPKRYDILMNRVLALVSLTIILILLIRKYLI